MKKSALMITAVITGICLSGFPKLLVAQTDSTLKKIQVVGSAEMEVMPDEINLNIALREYMKEGKNKVNIETLEKELQSVVLKAGIPKENFQIENVYGYNWIWGKKKPEEFLARKSYRIKLGDLSKVNNLLGSIDQKGIENVHIGEVTHSKIEDFKIELKAKALVAAKEKAAFLLKAIGEEAGRVIDIQELHEGYVQPYYESRMDLKSTSMEMAEAPIDFRKIKLKYEMRASFEIK